MESINKIVGSYFIRVPAVLALRGLCFNDYRSVIKDLWRGLRISEEIAHAREAQTEFL
jgi:hypothetical protein